jgi:hypothetical protein
VRIRSVILLVLLTSACGAAPTAPAISPEELENTVVVRASTAVAQTQAAIPTNTFPPPTESPTETFVPTNTPEPSATIDLFLPTETASSTFTLTPTNAPTFAPQANATPTNDCNHPLVVWRGATATFTIVNQTRPQGTITLLMSVRAKTGECGWLNIVSNTFSGPVGSYSAGAFVDGTRDFKVFGTFEIQQGAWEVIVRNDRIVAHGDF